MRRLRVSAAAMVAALGVALASTAPSSPFTTTLDGDGGPPVGETYVGTSGTSTMYLNLLGAYPDAVCNGETACDVCALPCARMCCAEASSVFSTTHGRSPQLTRVSHSSDGTPGGYYIATGSGTGVNQWLVYLEGSMFCWSATSCTERYDDHQYWMSSSSWAPEMAQGGIFATDGTSPWGVANRVYVKYCSSDLWSGNVGASASTFNYSFRGSRIVAAVITDLLTNQGLAAGDSLLFGGCSAGAIGAMNNLDAVAAQLPPGIGFKGLLDAAALMNIQPSGWPWSSELIPLQTLLQEVVAVINPVFPAVCALRFPLATWKCLVGQYRMPLLSTPFFVNAPQFDEFELMYDTDNYAPSTAAQLAFVEEFQTGTLSLIASLPTGTGVFSPTCLVHCLSGQNTFTNVTVGGISMEQALSSWFDGATGVKVVSSCTGWACVNACGIAPSGLPCMMGTPGCTPIQLAVATSTTDDAEAQQHTVAAAEPSLSAVQSATLSAAIAAAAQPVVAAPQVVQRAAVTAVVTAQAPAAAAAGGAAAVAQKGVASRIGRRLQGNLSTSRRLLAAAPSCCGGRSVA